VAVCGVLALAGATRASAASAAPAPPATAAAPAPGAQRVQASALAEMQALAAEKRGRTAAQRKVESHLLYTLLRQRGDARLAAVPHLRISAPAADGSVVVDVSAVSRATVKAVVAAVHRLGGRIVGAQLRLAAVRARLPLAAVESLAAEPAVRFVRSASRANLEHVDSEGDATHLAAAARPRFGVDGSGVKVCALSDGIDSLATLQAAGELPPSVAVVPGQAGAGDEGTALLEILHDLAPGASLGFATATAGEASFAANISALAAAGCTILVDDISYPTEGVFQDTTVAQAVAQVTAGGVLYFSAADNAGNLDAGTSGTWEGDFTPNGTPAALSGAGPANDFGDGGQSDALTAPASYAVLQWTDPMGASCNDYDLYVMDSGLTTILDASTDTQDCSQDPIELVSGSLAAGDRLVVTLFAGENRLLNLQAYRGTLALATAGCIRGHSTVPAALAVAAAPSSAAAGPGYPSGPYPGPFTSAQQSEPYTCDGPRRIFFDGSGNLLPGAPAGNFSSSGGVVRLKPDITAADGVSTDVGIYARFYGTSAAAPHAAAIAALVASAAALSATEIRAALVSSAIDIQAPGVDRDTGAGLVMAPAALQAAGAQPRATLTLGPVAASEVTPNGDLGVSAGEDFQLAVTLANLGGATATAVSATLTTTTPGVGLTNGASLYPDIAAGTAAANATPFLFTPWSLPCGARIDFTLTVTFTGGGASPLVLHFALPTGAPGPPATFSYTGPPVPIPDATFAPDRSIVNGTPAVATLAVAGVPADTAKLVFRLDGATCSTDVGATTVGVDHPFVNDLSFDLVSPRGTRVTLLDEIDLDGHNFCQVVLDDTGGGPSIQSATSAQAPFTGTWLPANPLAAFAGENPNGTWQLVAVDHDPSSTGSIRAFSLVVTPALCRIPPHLAADLTATKAVIGGTLAPGGTVLYTITLANTGTGASFDNPGDELVDTLPPALTLTAATASLGTLTTSGNTVRWNGGVPAGAAVTITIAAAISAATPPQSLIANQAIVTYDPARTGTNTTALPTAAPGTAAAPTQFVVGGAIAAVPALTPIGLAALALALAAAATARLARRRHHNRRSTGADRRGSRW
jgi:uncharacterized repeat protein (TIGR01451 family)